MSRKIEFENEFKLHTLTQAHLKELFDLELVSSEIQLNSLRLDNLAFDLKTRSFVIIEYKNEFNADVLNQAQEYYDLVQENKEHFTDRLDEDTDVDFDKVRIMIIGPEFSQSQMEDAKSNFELWKVSLFDDGEVTYENLKNNEVKTLKINLDDLKQTEEMLLEGKSDEMKMLYENLKSRVLDEFPDVDIKFLVDQFSFRVNDNLICVVVFLKSSFNIYLYGRNLKDSNKTIDISQKSTGGTADYQFRYESDDDLDCFIDLFRQVYNQKGDGMSYKVCPACNSKNDLEEEYCLTCGQNLVESKEAEYVMSEKLPVPKDKIILLDLNYTLISNSWAIRYEKLPEKINKREYEHELVELIKDNYVILITASPYCTSYDSLKHIEENTDLRIDESYWNFRMRPHDLKRYWLKKAVLPTHGDDPNLYLAIESNENTRMMYAEFGIEARPKTDFI